VRRQEQAPLVGARLVAADGRRIGRVEAEFADYVLVRTFGLLPIDLYVPRSEFEEAESRLVLGCSRGEARKRFHRPLKRAPHD
jgi:hypothetical protein